MSTLALDIGGANIKTARRNGIFSTHPFALWQQPEKLLDQLRDSFGNPPNADRILFTMTGELCDCFSTRHDGVAFILDAMEQWAKGVPIAVWSIADAGFIGLDAARQNPLAVASANWHALATCVAKQHPTQNGLMIDIGSTTTDIIRLAQGKVHAIGLTDRDRLASGELVYTGVKRTALSTLSPQILWLEETENICAEHFATTGDVYTLIGNLPEDAGDCDTADGQPRDRKHCANRILRMVGSDLGMNTLNDAHELAQNFADMQQKLIQKEIARVADIEPDRAPDFIFLSGSGEFLVLPLTTERFPHAQTIRLSKIVSTHASEAACAWALMKLGEEISNDD